MTYKYIVLGAESLLFFLISLLSVGCNRDEVIIDEDVDYYRPATAASTSMNTQVLQYLPAPGQFINDGDTGGMPAIGSQAEANIWAQEHMERGLAVSLGAFGGFVVVAFDHSILNTGGYDFGVMGNAFVNPNGPAGTSNEPGIVYVMADENGNGVADDTWYEIPGSETDFIENYSVTYYKPSDIKEDVRWTDSLGGSGTVPYVEQFHSQDSYYPQWVHAQSYTLTGKRLSPKNSVNDKGIWNNAPYAWGYADNVGSDNASGLPQTSQFRISDAVKADGSKANLHHIDYVKVVTGVQASSGWLGEISTEVCGIVDLSIRLD